MNAVTASPAEKLECVERELRLRRQVYPRLIEQGRMTKRRADYEIEIMAEIVEDYRAAVETERLL